MKLELRLCSTHCHPVHYRRARLSLLLAPFSPKSLYSTTQQGHLSVYVTVTHRGYEIEIDCEPYIQLIYNRHLRRLVAQFQTESYWLHIETGCHKQADGSRSFCPMCGGRIIDPGLPVHGHSFYAFDSDEVAADPIEKEHAILIALVMPPPGACFRMNFPAMCQLSAKLHPPG